MNGLRPGFFFKNCGRLSFKTTTNEVELFGAEMEWPKKAKTRVLAKPYNVVQCK